MITIFKYPFDPRFDRQTVALSEDDADIDNRVYVPSKRVYPESCDFEFCKLLQQHGVVIPFTTWSPERYEQVKDKLFHGEIY